MRIDKELIRKRREFECFPIVNRGKLWYDNLSNEQLNELSKWYQRWLDATETGVIPQPLKWFDSKIMKEEILL